MATDGSNASAKALEFVLTKFKPDYSTGNGKRVPIHVSVTYVRMPSPLAPITIKSPIPWIRYPGLKEVGRKLVEQTVQKLIVVGLTAGPVRPLGQLAEEIMKVASRQHADLIMMGAKGPGAIEPVSLWKRLDAGGSARKLCGTRRSMTARSFERFPL